MRHILIFLIAVITVAGLFNLPDHSLQYKKRKKPGNLYAGQALSSWFSQRSFPGKTISMSTYSDGWNATKNNHQRMQFQGNWESIGPMNFGGRTLSLCFNPQNPNTIYAGSASGGLWRSYSSANGAEAWHQVATGFPILGVAAIAINPLDSNEIYIGTGEVYNDQNTGTGFAVRTTRGTYGIGILKSTDGGTSWSKSLDWSYDELKGVQDLLINPQNPATIFAATTEGTFRSFNSGLTWNLVQNSRMASDLLINPSDTSIVFVSAGNSFSPNPGIFRSIDGGSIFTKITTGLPAAFSGKAMLDVSESNPQVMYASVAEQLSGLGVYRSDNGGLNWYQANATDYQTYQGWYSHDVSVKPSDPDEFICSGINMWKSTDGGGNLVQTSYWYNWDFNDVTVGGPEGPPDYVHADIHRIYRHPDDEFIVYMATDGGIFRSFDGGDTFEGCNGGYHTQQFYANFSNSTSDSLFAIGGLQDNATAVYEGNPGWRRVIGGDGLSTAINPNDDQIVYGSSQYLNMDYSSDKAQTFYSLNVPGNSTNPYTNFAGPFVLCPSNTNILYAGRDIVYKSIDAGNNWIGTNGNNVLDGNAVLVLEVSDTFQGLVYAATAPVIVPQVGLFKTANGGNTWTNVTAGIPNRYIMDIEIDPVDNNKVYLAVSGFGTPHFYRTINGGTTWTAYGSGLPDVPANTIKIDPLNTSVIYLGNDIGIYVSLDGGLTWQTFNDGLIDGTFVMDISISESNRKLRLATHGKGVYERDMLPVTITGITETQTESLFTILPTITKDEITVELNNKNTVVELFSGSGKMVKKIINPEIVNLIDVRNFAPGVYYVRVNDNSSSSVKKFIKY